MLKFEENRIVKVSLESTHFIHPIPLAFVKPKKEDESSVIFIFNGGIGSNIPSNLLMNNSLFDNNYFVCYEKAFHNENKNKPSQFKKKYLLELDEVINYVKAKLPNLKIYLIGESWGSCINYVYYKKFKDKIAGVASWNAVFGIVNVEHRPLKELINIALKEVFTLITNIETTLPLARSDQSLYTQDRLLARLLQMVPPSKNSAKTTLSVWKFMKPAYRFIKKYGKNPNYNFLYIQSGQDKLSKQKHIEILKKKCDSNHFIFMPTGYHILSMEPKESIELFSAIGDFIKKN